MPKLSMKLKGSFLGKVLLQNELLQIQSSIQRGSWGF
jgi:hypothetical protein